MCKMASFIVTRDKGYRSLMTDSHADIIKGFGLGALDADTSNVDLVRIEIAPEESYYTLPLAEWQFRTGQDLLPDWYDPTDAEKRCRIALERWAERKVLRNTHDVSAGNFIAIGNASVQAGGNANVWALDNASVQAWNNATIIQWSSASTAMLIPGSRAVLVDRSKTPVSCIVAI